MILTIYLYLVNLKHLILLKNLRVPFSMRTIFKKGLIVNYLLLGWIATEILFAKISLRAIREAFQAEAEI